MFNAEIFDFPLVLPPSTFHCHIRMWSRSECREALRNNTCFLLKTQQFPRKTYPSVMGNDTHQTAGERPCKRQWLLTTTSPWVTALLSGLCWDGTQVFGGNRTQAPCCTTSWAGCPHSLALTFWHFYCRDGKELNIWNPEGQQLFFLSTSCR